MTDETTRPLTPAPTDEPAVGGEVETAALPAPTPEIQAAIDELEAARSGVVDSLDDLNDASRSALDIPAKVRRNPVRTAALAGGAVFMLVGGPRRTVRIMTRRIRGDRPGPHRGILPEDVEKVLKDSGVTRDPEVRRALEDDFADYLRQKGRYGPEPGPAMTFWRTFDTIAGPLGTVAARILVQRLMEAERARGDRDRD